jgi:CheY-like chemotaxis protein
MKVLLLEDDQSKCEDIAEEVGRLLPDAELRTFPSYQSGLKALLAETFELVLLDMSMPTFDKTPKEPTGGRFRPFAGRDVLHHIRRRKLKTKALVVTAFDVIGEGAERIKFSDLDRQLRQLFADSYLGAIYYTRSSGDWRVRLTEVLKSQVKAC